MKNYYTHIGALIALLLPLLSFATDFGNRSVTQYEPYLEWQVTNVDYNGNAFDVVATVTFTHSSGASHVTEMFYDNNDTWKWRFSGSLTGNWTFLTSSSNGDLNGHSGSITVNQNNDNKVKGYIRQAGPNDLVKWAWSKDELAFIPNYDMYTIPEEFHNNPGKIDNDINRVMVEHGFTGFHIPSIAGWWFDIDRNGNAVVNSDGNTPDIETFEALELLITKTYKAGGAVHFWMWGDDSRKENMGFSSTDVMGSGEKDSIGTSPQD